MFKGKPRELVAADYVYQLKRVADPRWKSPLWTTIESSKVVGLAEARKQAQASGKFDYDRGDRRHPRAGSLHIPRSSSASRVRASTKT